MPLETEYVSGSTKRISVVTLSSYKFTIYGILLTVIASCSSQPRVIDEPSGSVIYESVDTQGDIGGIGIDPVDIVRVADQMYLDILQSEPVMNRSLPPRVLIDGESLRNESSSRVNVELLSDRIRINLNRSAGGRLVFVSRENIARVEKERALKREGVVDSGTLRSTQGTAGVDYQMFGRINTQDLIENSTQKQTRYHQIVFELVDMELGTVVWSNLYEFRKTARDDVLYR